MPIRVLREEREKFLFPELHLPNGIFHIPFDRLALAFPGRIFLGAKGNLRCVPAAAIVSRSFAVGSRANEHSERRKRTTEWEKTNRYIQTQRREHTVGCVRRRNGTPNGKERASPRLSPFACVRSAFSSLLIASYQITCSTVRNSRMRRR